MEEESRDEVLSRVLPERTSMDVTLKVEGVYSLPEAWKNGIGEEGAVNYDYEVNLLGVTLKGGSILPRELSDEEKAEAEAEADKGKKGKPAKGKP